MSGLLSELDALRYLCDSPAGGPADWSKYCDVLANAHRQGLLVEANEQQERDAERYRLLRSVPQWPKKHRPRVVRIDADGGLQLLTGDVLDRDCDAAQAEDARR